MKYLSFVLLSFILAGCSQTYDQDSWKTLIPESCKSFSDGCNTCTRVSENGLAACTKKFCQKYEEPVCLDEPITSTEATAISYLCADDQSFTVHMGEYVSGNAALQLEDNQIMVFDDQAQVNYSLIKPVNAWEEYYEDPNGMRLTFEYSGTAILSRNDTVLYDECVPQ